MPQTVPSRPTKGAVEPTVASRTWPNCSLPSTACRASRSTRVSCCPRLPACASVSVAGAWATVSAATTSGSTMASRSNAARTWRAAPKPGACQKAAMQRVTSLAARRSTHTFQTITTQLATDIASRHSAVPCVTASPWYHQCSGSMARASVQAEHVEHVEHAGAVRAQEAHRTQAALRIGGAARRFVRDFDALAGTGEQHGVVAHDVAAPDGGKTDARRVALAGHAFAGIDGAVLEVAAERSGDDFTHLERRARGGIDLVAVVRLDDFDVVAGGQRLGRHLQQFEGDVHAHAHVGRHDDGRALRVGGDLGFLRFSEAGGADDRLDAQLGTHRQMGQRALGTREVD